MTISIYQLPNEFMLIDQNGNYIRRCTLEETIEHYFTQGGQGKFLSKWYLSCMPPNTTLIHSFTPEAFQDHYPEYFI
jgi:hypothetical protein